MGIVSLNDIIITPLQRITTDGGDIMHAIKASSPGFKKFGEAYFSWTDEGAIKAWKKHQNMTLNLVAPLGEIRLVFSLGNNKNEYRVEDIGEKRYIRLTVPPGIWFGFQGRASKSSLLMNIADIEHDSSEVLRKPVSAFSYDWSLK